MKDRYKISEVVRLTGLSRGHIDKLSVEGWIELVNGEMTADDLARIHDEQETYISLYELACKHSSDKFDGQKSHNRNKLLDVLEKNDFFGLKIIDADELLIGTNRDGIFFLREDEEVLEQNLGTFFKMYGVTEEEIISSLIRTTPGHETTKEWLEKYDDLFMYEKSITSAYTDFVRIVLDVPDIPNVKDEHIKACLWRATREATKDHILAFFNYVRVRSKEKVKYHAIERTKKQKSSVTAYPDDIYLGLATCLFNARYIHEHDMINNALNNHLFAELWLYLSLFYVCGWRAADVCRNWKYLRLHERTEPVLDLNPETLYDDIKYDRIPDETYEAVCQYAIGAINISGSLPHKTAAYNPTELRIAITPELHTFFGLLTLIAESHMLRSGDGYMLPKRSSEYQNKMRLREFFGQEMWELLDGKNIQSRRLNKDYLQGTEKAARDSGCGGLMASAIASYARNHTNLNTIRTYLQDHRLNGETAEMVLYYMLERGVMGFEIYQSLVTAFPDAMRGLSLKKQNEIIKMIEMQPLELEEAQSEVLASQSIRNEFISGDEETVLRMLKSMFEISQNRGKAKEAGVYCLKRASKEACTYPEYRSCLANGCPHLVFTRIGYIPLLEVLNDYYQKAKSGDNKAEAVFRKILMPRYQSILNQLVKDMNMSNEEKIALKDMLKDNIYG